MDKSFKIASLKNAQLKLKGRIYPSKITVPAKTYYPPIIDERRISTQSISYSPPSITKIISVRRVKIKKLQTDQKNLKLNLKIK